MKKKLSFWSVVYLVIGSVIGAGIFFKTQSVLDNSNQNVVWALFVWLLAASVIICMGLALVEITSKDSNNLGLINWCQRFCSPFIASCCKYFIVFIYLPLNYFFMPAYVVQSFQDGLKAWGYSGVFSSKHAWLIVTLIGFAISGWFIATGVSAKIGNIQNWIVSTVNFVPIVAAIVVGIILLSKYGAQNAPLSETRWVAVYNQKGQAEFTLWTSSPLVGMFGALAAIFFAFDGFYFPAGIQSEMKQPKKISRAIVVGLLIITTVYVTVSTVMTFATSGGKFEGYNDFFKNIGHPWLGGVLNITIAIGVLSIINGISLWIPRFLEDLIKNKELWAPKNLEKKLNPSRPVVGVIYELVITVPIVIVCSLIGGLGYIPGGYLGSYEVEGVESLARYYNFADLMGNWTTVFCFCWIIAALFGGILNRKSNKVEVVKDKKFIPTAVFSIIFVGLSMLFSVLQPFIDLVIISIGRTWEETRTDGGFIGNILLIITLLFFTFCTVVPSFFELRVKKIKLVKK